MEKPFQKWVNLSYIAVAALFYFLLFALLSRFAAQYDLELKIKNVDLVFRFAAIGLATVMFIILYRHPKANQFMNEVMVELSRVTWPTSKETTGATVIVLIVCIILGFILGLMDFIWTKAIQMVL